MALITTWTSPVQSAAQDLSAQRSALIAAAFGALVVAAASGLCDTASPCVTTGVAVAAPLVTGAIGAALGAGIGALIPTWKRSWIG